MSQSTSFNATGKRKTAIARVYLSPGKGNITINGVDYKTYFTEMYLQSLVEKPFAVLEVAKEFDVNVNACGGGIKGQAEATSLGISRALVKMDEQQKPPLRAAGLLTRDPRMVERKKFGQKKARKRFQFTKR